MNTSKTWLKKAIVFLVVAAMAITLFPFTGLKTVTKAKEGPNSLFAETEKYQATVSFGDDAGIPAGAYLVLTEFEEGSSEYAEAKDTLIQEDNGLDEGNFGMAAFDLTIYDAEGVPFEPSAPVQVNIQMKELPEDVDAASVAIQHLDESTGDTVVETVATTVPDEAGMVEVIDDTAEAEFTVESFSTFALTWKVGETEYSATIHWGYIGDGASSTASGEFHEFDASDLDTAVGSVNLRASYSGYEYVDAVYYTSIPDTVSIDASTSVEGRTFINDVITKEVATGSSSDYHWMAEDAQNAATPFTVANGSHIYVAYREPDPGHVPDPTPTEHDDIPTPVTNKKVVTNKNTDGSPDGTYTIELDITGKQIAETHKTGANVIIIYDISQSMSQSVGNITRLEASRRATHTLIETLNPGTNDIDLALITFAQDSQVRQFNGSNWTKNGSNITNVIDGITNVSSNLGTSWHEALEDANGLVPPDDDPTYVIFITDGCPSVNGLASSGHSHGAAGTSNTTDLCYTSAVAYAQILAGTKGQSYSSRVSSGNQSWTISGTGKGEHLYGIYTGTDTNNMLGQLITAAEGTGVITATSEDAIKTAFQNIAQTIVNNLGASGVTTTDGVTELSSLSADVHGAAGAFEYYRRGGKVKDLDGTEHEKYSSSANGGLGVTWADAPGAIYNDDGSVTWDLSSVGVAEADVTYVLRFTVWPSQEAYDLIANLNNGAVDYEDLDSDIQNQVYESGGKYYLKTNTTLNTSYTYKGKTYTDPVSFEQGQMILNETLMNVRKAFADTINSEDPFTSIIFYLKMTNPKDKGTEKEGTLYYYQTDGSLNEELVTEGTVKVKELPVNTGNGWKNSIYIAPGLMEGTEVLEEGHKYTLEEKIVQGSEYEYEFTPQTVRPMIIDGTLTYLVLVDEYNAPGKNGVPADAKTYTIEGETYYVASTNNGELVGTNRKTAELDITKIVDTNEILTKDEEEEESFTYRVTLQIPHDNRIDPAGIMGYEYVNRPTQDNAFYAYGYHQYTKEEWEALGNEGDPPAATAYSEDKDRLGGNKYRRYNTHVYRDLLADGGWTTVGGKVKLVRDSDGNIQWKNDPVGGYHTVTYDMTLKQSELIRFTNLPSGTKYTIQEIYANKYVADNNGNSSGLAPISDASNIAEEGYAVTVKSTDGTVSKTAVDNDTVSGTISGLDTRYYNQFTNTMTKTVDVNLAGTKNLEGYEWSGESYHFTLETTGSNPMPAEATGKTEFDLTAASGNSDQTDTFGRIRFTAAGTYTYTVSETNAGTLQIVNGKAVQFGDAVTMTIVIQEDETTHDLSVKSVTGTGASWDADSKTATATITNTAPTVDIQATKEWLNEDGTKTPPSGAKATFTLYADGEKTDKSIVLDGTVDTNGETAEWVATFSGLQKYKVVEEKTTGEDGEEIITSKIVEIVYTVDETAVTPEGAYAKTNTDPVGNEGTIINEEQVTEVSGTKTWVDNNDQDGLRPDSITVTVIGRVGEGDEAETVSSTDHVVGLDENGKALEGTTVDADDENKWSFTFGNLPRFSDGKIISYSIVETDENVPSGYTRTADGNDITNTHTPATTDVTATKTWSDAGNQDGFRPASVVYALYKTPKGGTETAVLDDEGKAVTATLTGTGDEWTYTFEDLPAYESGKELTYTIKEMNGEAAVADGETLPGLEGAEYTAAYGKDGLTVTNSYTPATITINGTKTWDDEKYFDEEGNPVGDYERPEITINLSGTVEGAEEPVVTVTATLDGTADTAPEGTEAAGYESAAWEYTFVNLPKYSGGKEITYTVTETDADGFAVEIRDYDVINTPEEKKVVNPTDEKESIKIVKVDAATGTGTGLAGAVFTLTDSEGNETTYTTGEDGTVTISFAGYETNEDVEVAKTSTYTLKETTAPEGYEPNGTTYKITVTEDLVSVTLKTNIWEWLYNQLTGVSADYDDETGVLTVQDPPKTTQITAKKVWNDRSNQSGYRPESVVYALYKTPKGGNEKAVLDDQGNPVTATLTGTGDEWTYTFEDLPAYEDGKELTYTIKEMNGDAVVEDEGILPGLKRGEYIASYSNDSLTVTNKLNFGDLIIDKTVEKFSYLPDAGEVTFTYHIVATKNGKTVYDDYEALSFNAEDPTFNHDQVKIEGKIPVGATVTVTEVNDGAGYKSSDGVTEVSDLEITDPTDTEAKTATASFKNTFGDEFPSGYGIVNHYTKDGKDWKRTEDPAVN